jgi:dephospho-CoA kinase
MKKVAITGGIGSGKTRVCNLLQEKGYPVYPSDEKAKYIMVQDGGLRTKLIALLGPEAYLVDKAGQVFDLNKGFISAAIFENPSLKTRLELLVHPIVREDFEKWSNEQASSLVFHESALVLLTEYYLHFDAVVLVNAPESIRVERVMKRDGLSREAVLKRIQSQPIYEELVERATYLIDNSGVIRLDDQVLALLEDLIKA